MSTYHPNPFTNNSDAQNEFYIVLIKTVYEFKEYSYNKQDWVQMYAVLNSYRGYNK